MALKNERVAINRVHERGKKGGHGVPDEVVKKCYNQSNHNLTTVAFKADNVVITTIIAKNLYQFTEDNMTR